MRYVNLHTHSTFSDGKHTLEEMLLSAMEKNMLGIGFSDHSHTLCDESYCMLTPQYEAYFAEIARLKEKYGHQIGIYAGMELDYYSEMGDWPFDYILASVHYIIKDGVTHPIDHSAQQQLTCIEAFGGDVLAMAQCYYDMLCEHVERCKPTFVGHFDVITKFGLMPEEDEAYRKIARDALKRILKTCPYIEMNTGAISRGVRTVPYPCDYLLDTIRENGGQILLSGDSHHRDNVIFGFDECVERLKTFGFDHIVQFNGKGFDRFDI